MSVTYFITSESSYIGTTSVVDYTVRYYNNGSLIYSYVRRSISYSGVYSPSYTTIVTEASTNISSLNSIVCSDSVPPDLVCNINSSRLELSNIIALSDGRLFGNYLSSDLPIDFNSPYCNAVIFTKVRHNFSNGYLDETYASGLLYIYDDNGSLSSNPCDFGNSVSSYNCSYCSLSYTVLNDVYAPVVDPVTDPIIDPVPDPVICPYFSIELSTDFIYSTYYKADIFQKDYLNNKHFVQKFYVTGAGSDYDTVTKMAEDWINLQPCVPYMEATDCCLLVCCEPELYYLIT